MDVVNQLKGDVQGMVKAGGCVAARGETILIVDDDEGVTQTFARMLKLEGYRVRTAVNAESGLQEAVRVRPDAIILDLRMPMLDGLGFLRRLRSSDAPH